MDKEEKKTLYERVFRTKEYYLYDPFSQEFIGYRLHGVRYEESTPDAQGRIYSPTTGLFLAVRNEQLRWLTPEGDVVSTPMELADHERQRADHERQRAERAEQLLEAYLRRFGKLE